MKTCIVLLAVPFSLVGAFWLLYLCGYQFSVAVAVGLIALAGIDAETGVVMLIYLDQAYNDRVARGEMNNFTDLVVAVKEGAVAAHSAQDDDHGRDSLWPIAHYVGATVPARK